MWFAMGIISMWHDISNKVSIEKGKIIHDGEVVGVLDSGLIGVIKDKYRVRMEREYDEEGYINQFFIEQDTAGKTIPELFKIAEKSANIVPLVEVRNMQLLELNIKGKEIFFNVGLIESFTKKTGNISVIKMQSGTEYEVDYNVQRIKQKIGEATSKPAT